MASELQQRLARWIAYLPVAPQLKALWTPLFLPGLLRAAPKLGLLSHLPVTEADLTKLAALTGPVHARIPATACLERRIELPLAARGEATQAADLYLRAHLPHGGRGLIWRVQPKGEAEGRLHLNALIVKEAHLADLVSRARTAKIALHAVELEDLTARPLWEADPIPPRVLRSWAAGSFLAVALIALVAVGVTERRVRDLRDLTEQSAARVAVLRERVAERQALAQAVADHGNALATQWLSYRAGARPLAGLAAIGSALPSDVWLSELAMSGADWRLSGFSAGDVSRAVTALQALPGARNVRLDGPIQFDSFSTQNRFDLVLTLMPGGQQ